MIVVDYWCDLCRNCSILLWPTILIRYTWLVLFTDGNIIPDWNILSAGLMPVLAKHRRHNLENDLCKKMKTVTLLKISMKFVFFFVKELIYHTVAAILLLIASVYLLVKIQDYKHTTLYDNYIVVAVSPPQFKIDYIAFS